MNVKLVRFPNDADWMAVKARALRTVHREAKKEPTLEWKSRILEARHSPIRYLQFSFFLEDIPTKVANHLVRHVHAQPYVESNRNDRQSAMTDAEVNRLTPVSMFLDVNAEELMVIANKRLCAQAEKDTREVVRMMCGEVIKHCPEFKGLLVPMCEYQGYVCHEMQPCGAYPHWRNRRDEE